MIIIQKALHELNAKSLHISHHMDISSGDQEEKNRGGKKSNGLKSEDLLLARITDIQIRYGLLLKHFRTQKKAELEEGGKGGERGYSPDVKIYHISTGRWNHG